MAKIDPKKISLAEIYPNTQDIQEWEKSFDKEFPDILIENEIICPTGCERRLVKDLKSFISQKLKEQEYRHKKELQTILSKVQEDVDFGAKRGQMVQTKAQAYLLTILSKYEN